MSYPPTSDRRDAGRAEYLLIIVLVALLVIGAVILLGPAIANLIAQFGSNF
jgi:Flp pilus assembly pilin Flp